MLSSGNGLETSVDDRSRGAKALSTDMGHASVMITLDRYGHLFPGNEEEAAGLPDGYLAKAVAGSSKRATEPMTMK